MSQQALFSHELHPADKELPAHLQSWLNTNNSNAIYSGFEWFQNLSLFKKQYQSAQSICYKWCVIYYSGKPCVAVPLEVNSRKLKVISNFYTPYFDLFFDKELFSYYEAWQISLEALGAAFPNWLSLDITPLYPHQVAVIKKLTEGYPFTSYQYHFSVNYQCKFAEFASYWNSRSSRLKNTYKRRLKALSKENYKLAIFNNITAEIKDYYWQVYQQSWKMQEPSECFINWLMDWSAYNKKLQLGVLFINERPVAVQLWLVQDKTASIFKLAQDKLYDTFSPGTVLTKHMIEHLASHNDVKCIDFLLGDDEFKALWMDSKQQVSGLEIINQTTLSGKLFAHIYNIRDFIKKHTGINFSRKRHAK